MVGLHEKMNSNIMQILQCSADPPFLFKTDSLYLTVDCLTQTVWRAQI
jgi:hypothetical protein